MKHSVKYGYYGILVSVLFCSDCRGANSFDSAFEIFSTAIQRVGGLLGAAQQNGIIQFQTKTMLDQLGEFTQAINKQELQKELRQEMTLLFSQNKKLADEKRELMQQVEEQVRRTSEAEKEKIEFVTKQENAIQGLRKEFEIKLAEQQKKEILWNSEKTDFLQKQQVLEKQLAEQKENLEKEKIALATTVELERKSVQDAQQRLAALQGEQSLAKKDLDSAKKALADSQQEFTIKQQQIQQELKRLQQVAQEKVQAEQQIKNLNAEQQKLTQEITGLKSQLESVSRENKQLSTQAIQSKEQAASLQSQIMQQSEKMRVQGEQLTTLASEKSRLDSQAQVLTNTIEQERKTQDSLRKEIEQQKTLVEKVTTEFAFSKKQLEQKEKELLSQKITLEKQVAMSKERDEKMLKIAQQFKNPISVEGGNSTTMWNEKYGERIQDYNSEEKSSLGLAKAFKQVPKDFESSSTTKFGFPARDIGENREFSTQTTETAVAQANPFPKYQNLPQKKPGFNQMNLAQNVLGPVMKQIKQ